jgi:hypothetical protein
MFLKEYFGNDLRLNDEIKTITHKLDHVLKVKENMGFERTGDVKKSLDIGYTDEYDDINPGDILISKRNIPLDRYFINEKGRTKIIPKGTKLEVILFNEIPNWEVNEIPEYEQGGYRFYYRNMDDENRFSSIIFNVTMEDMRKYFLKKRKHKSNEDN